MGRFDNIAATPTPTVAPTLPGVGKFDMLGATASGSRFANISPVQGSTPQSTEQTGNLNTFGGVPGALGRILTAPQAFTTGLIEKGLEKTGVLKPSDQTGPVQAVKKQESNIDLLKRVGAETGKGSLLTGQYTPTTSVFGNFIREIPVTAIGTAADIYADPLTYAGGFGILKRATKAIGGLIEEGAKSLAQEIPAVQKIGDILGKAFITRYGQSAEFKALDRQRLIQESLAQEKVQKLTSDIIEQPAAIQRRITEVLKGVLDEPPVASQNIANGDRKIAAAINDAWPTTASKPSKGGVTSTGSAPIGKEGVSAQRAGTSGPFDASPIPGTTLERVPISDLKAGFTSNREISVKKVNAIKADIQSTGKVKPLFADDLSTVDGHHRLIALHQLGITEIPVYKFKGDLTVIDPAERKALAKSYLANNSKVSVSSPSIPKELEPLAAEARKYKSAEEFVQKTAIHRGDAQAIPFEKLNTVAAFDASKKEALSAFNNTPGLYFSTSVDNARSYGSNLTSVKIKPNARIIDISSSRKPLTRSEVERIVRSNPNIADHALNYSDYSDNLDKGVKQIVDEVMAQTDGNEFMKAIWADGGFSDDGFVSAMKNAGIDGLKVPKDGVTHYVIYNKDALLTKSQLIDFYNKVKGGMPTGKIPFEQPSAVNSAAEDVLTPKQREIVSYLAQPIREELDRVGESISKLNPKLLDPATFEANKGTYFPRLYTDYEFPKTDEEVITQAFGRRAVSIPKAPFKARKLTEEQSIAKGTRIEEAGYPALKRLTQLNITEQRQQFFKETAKLASDQPKPGWIQLSEDKALGDLAGKFLPAAEYKAIADLRHVPSITEETYQKALTLWKTFKTAYNPATISRNNLTNFFVLNPLGGVGPHRLDIYARTTNELLTKGPLYQLARAEGLELSTQQAAELTQQASRFYRENKSLVGQFFDKVSDFHDTVKNFYGSQDKFFKLANFIKGVTEDGMTPAEALRRSNFYLIDYSEVPQFVEWLRKSPIGIPFISFTYGVSKPLAKTLVEHPERLAAYFKILRGIQSMNPLGETPAERQSEQDVLPDWISTGTYLRLPVKDKFGRSQYVDLQYILPFNILENHSILPSNPILNVIAGLLANKDIFTGKDITLPTDTPLEKAQKYATNLFGQFLPSATPFVGTSFNKVYAALQQRPDRNGFVKSKLEVLVDVLGGIKITPIDPTVEAQKRAGEREKEIQQLRSQLKTLILDKSLFPEERTRQVQDIQSKIENAASPTSSTQQNSPLAVSENPSPNDTTEPSLLSQLLGVQIARAANKEIVYKQ